MGRLREAWRAFMGRQPAGGVQAYDAGRITRADPDFVPSLTGPNLLADRYLDLTRRRSRHLWDNHPNMRGARETMVNNIVGTGAYFEPATGDRALDKQIRNLLWQFYAHADPGREISQADIQAEGQREEIGVGEVMSYVSMAPAFRGFPEAPAIELIDTDRLPLQDGVFGPMAAGPRAGARIRQGVEFDRLGRRVAYHVYEDHPADGGVNFGGYATRAISSEWAFLQFERNRIRQVRGIPPIVASAGTTRMEDAYYEANILMAQALASVGLYFTGVSPPKGQQSDYLVDGRGEKIVRFEFGQVGYMPRGADLKVANPQLPGQAFVPTMELLQRRAAAGLNMSYTAFTRDSSKATFAAQRADSLEDRKGYRRRQEKLARVALLPWVYAMIDWGVATQRITLSAEQTRRFVEDRTFLRAGTVVFNGWEWVNPAQEAAADKIALEIGKTSQKRIAAQAGAHWQDIVDEQLEVELYEQNERERLGLPPRATTATGVVVHTGDEDKPAKDGEEDTGEESGGRDGSRAGKKSGFGGRLGRLLGVGGGDGA